MSGHWREELRGYLRRQANPSYKYTHQPRLYALTQEIAAAAVPTPSYDDDVVFAAAFLHDLGVFVGHRPEDPSRLKTWDHVGYACEHAPAILARCGFPADKLPVLACIREHQPQDDPQTFEATLLRDADMLEQLGAMGVLRTVTKVGSDTRFGSFADARDSLRRALEGLPGKLRLDASRRLAELKIATLTAFLDAVDAEGGAYLD
jgi:uncharacterized protein